MGRRGALRPRSRARRPPIDQHRTDRQQWNVDIDRAEEFTAEGYLVIRITAARMRRPRHVVGKVFAALRQRGYRGPAPVFHSEWSALFELSAQVRPETGISNGP